MGGLVSFLASQFVHWLTVVRWVVETTEGIYVCDSVSLDAASLGRRQLQPLAVLLRCGLPDEKVSVERIFNCC